MVKNKSTSSDDDASVVKPSKTSTKQAEPTSMDELLAQTGYHIKGVKRGEVIDGTILSVSPKHILLNIGGKGEGVVHEKELPYITDLIRDLKAGDVISVHVVNAENDRGQVVVSLRRTAMHKRWEVLTKALNDKSEVEIAVRELGKGGFLIDYQGLRGFVPLSQADPELVKLGDRVSGRRVKARV